MTDCKVVLVTGANGFVGRAVVERIERKEGWSPLAAVRRPHGSQRPGVQGVTVGDIGPDTQWSDAVRGVEAVVHAAARVHVMHDRAADPLALFRKINVQGTERLGRQAAAAGVRRFVFISSIKVNGERTGIGTPFTEKSAPQPMDPYAVSKHEAEIALANIAQETGMEVVIVRPPLVYGPGVKANFRSMMSWIKRGLPIPFGSIRNRRSFVAVDNLADLIVHALADPRAANQTFLASDGEDLSTSELIRRMAMALRRPARLLPVPPTLLMTSLTLIGKRGVADRLLGSLQVDSSKARSLLGWQPPLSVDAGLRLAADDYLLSTRS